MRWRFPQRFGILKTHSFIHGPAGLRAQRAPCKGPVSLAGQRLLPRLLVGPGTPDPGAPRPARLPLQQPCPRLGGPTPEPPPQLPCRVLLPPGSHPIPGLAQAGLRPLAERAEGGQGRGLQRRPGRRGLAVAPDSLILLLVRLSPQSARSWCAESAGRAGWWCTAAWSGTWACCASTPGSPPPW